MTKNFTLSVFLFLLISIPGFTQNNVWNAVSFKFSTDTISLENMSGATAISFPGSTPYATDTISFPSGFSFHYGLDEFTRFSVSRYGWLKLGTKISQTFYTTEDNILVPFSNQSSIFTSSYKLIGAAPSRKFVIEWSGTFSGGSQPVRFQLWLNERTGRIDFVHQNLNTYFSGGSYNTFCRTKILGETAFASIDVQTPPVTPVINYTSVVANNEAIPAKTRYTFQPDTIKPVSPGIQFSNILPGCFSVDVKDSSTTEVFFNLEKKLQGSNYFFSKRSFSTTIATTGTLYTHNEVDAKPDSLYTYRSFASNGFVNSDTTIATVLTPAPLIYGVKMIPGDYPTINALLLDAKCKHMGPNLVIELQPGYSFAAEGGVVRFKPINQNKFIQSITIRPAAAATNLLLGNTGAYPLFAIDSVPYVHIDGRAGGVGSSNNLTINQADIYLPAITFMDNANGGGIHYVNIEGKSKHPTDGLVFFGARDPQVYNSSYTYAVNGATVNNCKFGPSAVNTFTYRELEIEGGDSITIRDNEFFRFFNEAVNYTNGGKNSRVVKNRLYLPEYMPSQDGTTPTSSLGAMVFTDMKDNFTADSNRLGGSSATWGVGVWKQDLKSTNNGYGMIRVSSYNSFSLDNTVYIRNNEFGNINTNGSNQLYQVYAKGNSYISNNKIGTADSVSSIVTTYLQSAIYPNLGKRSVVTNNFFSGLKGGSDGAMIRGYSMDSLFISGNDAGGSNNYNANVFSGILNGIEMGGVKYSVVKNNLVRGLTSQTMSAYGITQELGYYTPVERYSIVDSNIIHHLDARRTVMGIFMRLSTTKDNSISFNNIYALHGRGPSNFTGADNPTSIFGISTDAFEFTSNIPSIDTGFVNISSNKIYALDYTTPSYYYLYPMTGIAAHGLAFRINNNMISLGTNTAGAISDSLELQCIGIDIYSTVRSFVEHNSIYIGGRNRSDNIGIKVPINNYSTGQKDAFVSNNIIQIDRVATNFNENKSYMSSTNSSSNNIVANKNIWYSNSDTSINTKLQLWRSHCKCDSLAFIADPKFINPSGDSNSVNLHLQALSPADSAGTPPISPVPVDFDVQVRNNYSPVDIGADAVSPCGGTGNENISISPSQQKIEICPSSSLTLTATLSGSVSALQWQKNLNDIPGANGTSYNVTTAGSYRLVGRTACSRIASSSVFVLTGVTQPYMKLEAITTGPYCDSTDVEMKITHVHSTLTTLQYKWYRNNVLMPGKTTDHETIEAIRYGDRIRADVINNTGCGTNTVTSYIDFNNVNSSTRLKINIQSYTDSLYSFTNRDTVKYRITPLGYGPASVIYTSPVPGPMHTYVSDSMVIFTDVPYSFKFRLATTGVGLCVFADTTQEKTIYVSNSSIPKTYTFSGNGNWSDPSNWSNNEIPPSPLPFNATVVVNPSGSCVLNVPYTVGIGGQFIIMPGAVFVIQGNLIRQ